MIGGPTIVKPSASLTAIMYRLDCAFQVWMRSSAGSAALSHSAIAVFTSRPSRCPRCGRVTKIYDALCTRCGAELEFPHSALAPESWERTPASS